MPDSETGLFVLGRIEMRNTLNVTARSGCDGTERDSPDFIHAVRYGADALDPLERAFGLGVLNIITRDTRLALELRGRIR
jgi:hypothetical protein